MKPLLSIVIPVLNEAGQLPQVLAALQSLRASGVELLLADGGSTDTSTALAAPWVDRLITAPRGRARQMNAGAAEASGACFLFLHADTQLPPKADQLLAQALAAGARWGRFDVQLVGRSRWLPVISGFINHRSRWSRIATGDQALFIERRLFEQLGGFPDQPLMEDIELCKRLKQLGIEPACLRARVRSSGRRWDERGALRTMFLMWRLRWRYWRGESAQSIWQAYQ